jgi:hypothetical protein
MSKILGQIHVGSGSEKIIPNPQHCVQQKKKAHIFIFTRQIITESQVLI